MNRHALALCSIAVVSQAAACSLAMGFDGFVGDKKETDGGSGQTSDGGSVATNEGGQDSGPEVLGPGDGGDVFVPDPNIGPVFVDGGTTCKTTPGAALCDDFDAFDLTTNWVREGNYARLTSYAASSAPNNFLLSAPAQNSGGNFVSKISHAFDQDSGDLLVGFDIYPEKVADSAFLILGALEYTSGTAKYSIRLVYSNGQVRVEESDLVPPPNNHDVLHPFFTIEPKKWSRVKLDITLDGGSPTIKILLDDIPVGGSPLAATPTAGISWKPTLILGAVFAGAPHSGWTLRYDNVLVSFR